MLNRRAPNVTNLFLVRIERDSRNWPFRAALGAGWARRWSERLLVESVMLGLMGGVLSAALAYAGRAFAVGHWPGQSAAP